VCVCSHVCVCVCTNELSHIYVYERMMSDMSTNESCRTYIYEWVMSHIYVYMRNCHVTYICMNESCHTFMHEWVVSYIYIYIYMSESCRMHVFICMSRVIIHVWMSHGTQNMYESCQVYIRMRHPAHIYGWSMSHTWMSPLAKKKMKWRSHGIHIHECVTAHIYAWVILHVWTHQVTHIHGWRKM